MFLPLPHHRSQILLRICKSIFGEVEFPVSAGRDLSCFYLFCGGKVGLCSCLVFRVGNSYFFLSGLRFSLNVKEGSGE